MKILRITVAYGECECSETGARGFSPEAVRISDVVVTTGDVLSDNNKPTVISSVEEAIAVLKKTRDAP